MHKFYKAKTKITTNIEFNQIEALLNPDQTKSNKE